MYAGDAAAAPAFRAVDQHTGAVAPVPTSMAGAVVMCEHLAAERDKAVADLTEALAEIDNLTTELTTANKNAYSASVSRGAYQVERDELREQVDEWREKYGAAQCRMDELAADRDGFKQSAEELSAVLQSAFADSGRVKAERDAARAERDTANAKAASQS